MNDGKLVRELLEHPTFELVDGYDRKKKPRLVTVRRMTREEVLAVTGDVWFIANDGKLRVLRINGAIKRWKRDPDRVEIPVKYGMYETARLSLDEALAKFVVE